MRVNKHHRMNGGVLLKKYFEERIAGIVSKESKIDGFIADNLKNYPAYLYKYRECDKDYNFDMVEEGYLWADKPSNFDDPSDSWVYLKLKSELPSIEKWLKNHLGEILYYCIISNDVKKYDNDQLLQECLDAHKLFEDSIGRYNEQKAKKYIFSETEKLNENDRKEVVRGIEIIESDEFKKKIMSAITKFLTSMANKLRENYLVCCLTMRKDNQKMWEEYARKYTGFVIEYNIFNLEEQSEYFKTILQTFPVKYYKRMPKAPLLPFIQRIFYKSIYNKDIDIIDAEIKWFKQLLIKKDEYSREEEWRIISSTQRIEFPLISAIYMGYKISDEHRQRLEEICSRNGVPLYIQKFDSYEGVMTFELVKNDVCR